MQQQQNGLLAGTSSGTDLVKKKTRGTWQINSFAKSQFDYFLKFYHFGHIKILEKKGMK